MMTRGLRPGKIYSGQNYCSNNDNNSNILFYNIINTLPSEEKQSETHFTLGVIRTRTQGRYKMILEGFAISIFFQYYIIVDNELTFHIIYLFYMLGMNILIWFT